MIILSILLILLPFGTSQSQVQVSSSDSLKNRSVIDTVFVLTVNDTMPHFRFHYTAYQGDRLEIVVSNLETGDTIQIIRHEFAVSLDPEESFEPFRMMDINYDGYTDLVLLTGQQDILGWQSYSYWLFQPSTGLFKLDEDLSSLLNDEPHFDLRNRIVKTSFVSYPNTSSREHDTYKFMNGSYVLIRRLKCDTYLDSDSTGSVRWVWTLEQWTHDKLLLTKKHIGFDAPRWALELE